MFTKSSAEERLKRVQVRLAALPSARFITSIKPHFYTSETLLSQLQNEVKAKVKNASAKRRDRQMMHHITASHPIRNILKVKISTK